MRILIAVLNLCWATGSLASSYHHCVAPLVNASDTEMLPQPEVSFRLTLGDHAPNAAFVGQGYTFDGRAVRHMKWHGNWTTYENAVQLIGAFSSETDTGEWRAHAISSESGVMILNVDRGDGGLQLMVRCLPAEGA